MAIFFIIIYCVFMAGILGLQFFHAFKNKGFLITLGCLAFLIGAIMLYRLLQGKEKRNEEIY